MTATKIWNYGARLLSGGEKVHEQLLLAHRYYNNLIQIEHQRRAAYREERDSIADIASVNEEYDELTKQIESARLEIKATRQAKRKRTRPVEGQSARIAELKEQRRAVGKRRAEIREKLKSSEHLKQRSKEIDESASESIRMLRKSSGVYWGTYLLYEKAFQSAKKSKVDPHFRRWSGEGRVGVQLQKGLSVKEALSCEDSRLRIQPLPDDSWNSRSKRRRAYSEVHIRIGTHDGEPVWAKLSVEMHRKLPSDGQIKWAWIKIIKVGTKVRYALQLTVQSEKFPTIPRGAGIAALDLGWRQLPSGAIRVGFLADEAGVRRSFEVPAVIRERLEFAQSLRSAADKHFNVARGYLQTWMAERQVPRWMKDDTTYIHQWRNPSRLAKLAAQWTSKVMDRERVSELFELWKKERKSRQEDLFAERPHIEAWLKAHGVDSEEHRMVLYLEFWRMKNSHLYNWERGQRRKILNRRNGLFKLWAKQLSGSYRTIVLERFDLRTMAQKAPVEAEEVQTTKMRYVRTVVAPSEFRHAIQLAFGEDAVDRDPAWTTQDCSTCGRENTVEDTSALMLPACPGCSEVIDQDENAAINLLKRYCEHRGDEKGRRGARSRKKNAA